MTSLALQVHGGMGYIEETGVAQHYRDIRIAPIYEGTNGIQAIDLVGRKLGLRAGDAIRGLLTAIDGTAAEATATGGELAVSASRSPMPPPRCATPPSGCSPTAPSHATRWPGRRRSCAWPASWSAGWLLTRSALAATASRRRRRRPLHVGVPPPEGGDRPLLRHPAAAAGRRPRPGGHRRRRRPLRRRLLSRSVSGNTTLASSFLTQTDDCQPASTRRRPGSGR